MHGWLRYVANVYYSVNALDALYSLNVPPIQNTQLLINRFLDYFHNSKSIIGPFKGRSSMTLNIRQWASLVDHTEHPSWCVKVSRSFLAHINKMKFASCLSTSRAIIKLTLIPKARKTHTSWPVRFPPRCR